MDYHKLMEAYKSGTLNEAQREQVAADIEKHEVISDYLMENAEIPGLEAFSPNFPTDVGRTNDGGASDMAEQIKKAIRRAFVKAGVIVGAVVLALTLAVLFLLPRFVDCFYYNPCEVAGVTQNGIETNRMTLDMAVWSELHLPGSYRDMVMCEREGYGSYSVYVPQTSSYSNSFTDVAGKLTRGKLTFYNPNVFKKDAANTFGRVSGIFDNGSEWSLPSDNRLYRAYVTFDKVMSYKELVAWCDANPAYSTEWCALCRRNDEPIAPSIGIGFCYNTGCTEMGFDSTEYPLLSIFSVYEKNNVGETFHIPEEDMTQHVISLLRYSEDHREFASMMKLTWQEGEYASFANTIEQDGIYVYGFTIIGSGDDIRALAQAQHIAGIYTEPLA